MEIVKKYHFFHFWTIYVLENRSKSCHAKVAFFMQCAVAFMLAHLIKYLER